MYSMNRTQRLGLLSLFALVIVTFALDFAHGISLGEDGILFHPRYRVRQTLAVALSQLRDPAAGGYLAYGSVLRVLNENGFADAPGDPGAILDADDFTSFVRRTNVLDHIIDEALQVPVRTDLPSDIIRGNELGYADYMVLAMRLFGAKVASFYFLYFSILGLSCLCYAVDFRKSPFLIYLLVIYLGEILFLETYATIKGGQLLSLANSRLFSALSLLPAAHVLFVLWRRRRPSAVTLVAVAVQALLLAFVVSCRYEAMWQIVMIYATATGLGCFLLLSKSPAGWMTAFAGRCSQLWPAVLVAIAVFVINGRIDASADQRYALEPKTHIVWHELMMGFLSASPALQQEYLGHEEEPYTDTMVYEAVVRDLNTRHDFRSPAAVVENGKVVSLRLMESWKEYERLVRSLALRVALHHPLQVAAGFYQKLYDQRDWYTARNGLAFRNFGVPILLWALAALAAAAAGAVGRNWPVIREGAVVTGIFLVFACMTPAIEPSALAVGSLLCYIAAVVVTISYATVLAVADPASLDEPGRHAATVA